MSAKRSSRGAEPKPCALCGGPLPAQKPVYLLHTQEGTIVGPYHSGCAYRIASQQKARPLVALTETEKASAYGFMAREETLPW